jgi:SAM-dependent methyltransferase
VFRDADGTGDTVCGQDSGGAAWGRIFGVTEELNKLLEFPPVLDACCGSRMFWFDRANKNAVFVDNRDEEHVLCDGRKLEIHPDIVADFTKLPFPDDTFYLVIFDPPHMTSLGEKAWLAKKYGRLIADWRDEIQEGFSECWRVLRRHGTLVFKWNSTDVALSDVLELAPVRPLFGHTTGRQAKTHWLCFFKS